MTKAAALYNFFSSFGLEAWRESNVYSLETAPAFPYLTYELTTDAFGEFDTALSFSLWYRSTSWGNADAKAEEISAAIGRTGKVLKVDGGYLLIMRASPFAQSLDDPSDDMIKRKLCNITVRYYTNN